MSANPTSNPQDLSTPAPSNPSNDLLSTLAAASGLGLNVAGAATRTGAVGDKTLNYADNRQQELNAQYAKDTKQRQAAKDQQTQALSDQKQLQAFVPVLSQLRPEQQTIAQSYIQANDLKGTQSYMERAMSDNRADQRLNKTLNSAAQSDDDKEITGGINEAQNRYKELGGTVDKSVAGAMQLQTLLQKADLTKGPPDVKKLGIVDKQVAGKSADEVQQMINDQYNAARPRDWLGRMEDKVGLTPSSTLSLNPLDTTNTTSKQVFQNFAAKIVGPEAVQDHLNKNSQMEQQQNTVDLLKFVKAYKNNPDPAIQAKVQTYRQAVLAAAKQ